MKNILVVGAVGVALFCVTVGGLLGVQGRLNYEGMKNIPLLNALFRPPAQSESAAESPRPSSKPEPRKPTASTPVEEAKPRRDPIGPEVGRPTFRGFAPGELFDLSKIESKGMTVDEVNAIVDEVRRAKSRLAKERAELLQLRRDLEVRERDVANRQTRVAGLMQQVLDERARLERSIADFNERVVELPVDEEAAFAETSRTVSKLLPEAAAELIVEFWQSPGGEVKVVKILAMMEEDRADEILACLDTKRVREILERRMTVIRTGQKKRRPR